MPSASFADVGRELLRVVDNSAVDLAGITDADAIQPRASGKWSRKQTLGHLIDSASNNHQRFVRAIEGRGGEFSSYNQDFLIELVRPNDVPWTVIVGLWSNYNRYLAHVLASMPADGAAHTVRVGADPQTTLLFIASDYVEHLKHHLNQILGNRFTTEYPHKAM